MDEVTHPEGETRVDRVLSYVAGEPMLWPIAFVVLAHFAAFVAPALILALRERRFSAMAAVALLVGSSIAAIHSENRRKGGLGAITLTIACAWVLTIAVAVAAVQLGVF